MNAPDPPVCPLSLTVAANVRLLRTELRWSQHHLAREAGISACMVSALEAGRRNFTMPVLEKIAGALGAEPAGLLKRAPAPGDGLPVLDLEAVT